MKANRVLPVFIFLSVMFALIPFSCFIFALPASILSATYGSEGKIIKVTGPAGAVPAGKTVQLYWDAEAGAWDGVKGLLNSTFASQDGAYEIWFEVPEATNGAHEVWVKDADGNAAPVDFTVETRNSNNPNTGMPGDTIESWFYGFHGTRDLAIILSSGDVPISTEVKDEVLASPDGVATEINGSFANKYVVPNSIHFRISDSQYARDDGEGNIVGYTEPSELSGSINYVTGAYDIILTEAPPAMQNGLRTDYSYWGTSSTSGSTQFDVGMGATNSVGTASISWEVPSNVTYLETYEIIAFDSVGMRNNAHFRIMGIQLSSYSGPTGQIITITGEGFIPNMTWAAEIGSMTLFEDGMVSSDGRLQGGTDIPIPFGLSPGTYIITVWDSEDEFDVWAKYTVKYNTSITVIPDTAPNNYNVTISGQGFSYLAAGWTDLAFTLYNTTSAGLTDVVWVMDVKQNLPVGGPQPATVNFTGIINAYWIVPGLDSLGIGTYNINVTDSDGYKGQATFSVIPPSGESMPRKTTLSIGDAILFQLEGSSNVAPIDGSTVKIYDSSGGLAFTSDAFDAERWIRNGTLFNLPCPAQTAEGKPMIVPENASPGTWSYRWIGTDGKDISSGTFEIVVVIPTGSLKVTVKDSNGNALSGVAVSSSKQPSGQTTLNGVTDTYGTVTFTGLVVGNYTFQASKSGYVSNSAQGSVTTGTETQLSATLQAEAQPGGGIPGFPMESIIIGVLLGSVILWLNSRRESNMLRSR